MPSSVSEMVVTWFLTAFRVDDGDICFLAQDPGTSPAELNEMDGETMWPLFTWPLLNVTLPPAARAHVAGFEASVEHTFPESLTPTE
jgi:hypothetical protein